jgi:hypothetical protein
MGSTRTPRRSISLAVAAATLVASLAAAFTTLSPRTAQAVTSNPLSAGTAATVNLQGTAQLNPAAVASPHAASGSHPAKPRLATPNKRSGTPAPVHPAVAVSPKVAGSAPLAQLQTSQGVSHDAQSPGVTPPDTNVAVSPNTVAEVVNFSLRAMNRDGTNVHTWPLAQIWGVNGFDATVNRSISDPRIAYDNGHWFLTSVIYDDVLLGGNSTAFSYLGMAVAANDQPTTWNVYLFTSQSGRLLDQPKLGLTSDDATTGKVTASAENWNYSGATPNPESAELVVYNRNDLQAAANPANINYRTDTVAVGYAPAISRSATGTQYVPFNNTVTAAQSMSVVSITGEPGAVTVAYAQADIPMCTIVGPATTCFFNGPASIQQPGSTACPSATIPCIDTNDDQFQNAVWQNNTLWAGANTGDCSGPQSCLLLVAANTSNMTLSAGPVPIVSNDSTESFAYPAIALDSGGTPYVAFSRGGPSRYMSSGAIAYVPSQNKVYDAGVLNGGAGQGVSNCGPTCVSATFGSRWGDYSGAAVDPTDPTTVWVGTEYAAVGNGNPANWGTLMTRVTFVPPTITSVSPGSGSTNGGTVITVTGTNFDETPTVLVDGISAATTWIDAQHLQAPTPQHKEGTVNVAVSSVTGSPVATGAFTYVKFKHAGYWLVASDGGIFSFGSAQFYGSTGAIRLNQPIVGMSPTKSNLGYWLVASDGGIFSFGDALFYGSTGAMRLNQPIVGMAATPSGKGYWLVASDGGIFSFGDALFFGSTGAMHLNQPIKGMATTPTGKGYWLVASDGGIFAFGDAAFFGSTGAMRLNQPVVGMATTSTGKGYWLVATDGGIFSFGDAKFFGSTGAIRLNQPIVGMAPTGVDGGYWLDASDGGIFAFGDAGFFGSTGAMRLNKPVVGMAAAP